MKKTTRIFVISVIILSVISASVFAAHIPPLWLPFSFSVFVLIVGLYFFNKSHIAELKKSNDSHNPVTIFLELIKRNKNLCLTLAKKTRYEKSDIRTLEDTLEFTANRLLQIHPQLRDVLGMKSFIDLILPYARSERSMNRALSAMMDGYFTEANQQLNESIPFLDETENKIAQYQRIKQ